jgi:multiple sugar transport system permease protein
MTTTAAPPASRRKSGGPVQTTDRARAERNLGLKLAAPAAIIMLLVTAYPIAYAVYLSLFPVRPARAGGERLRRARQLRADPDQRRLVGGGARDGGHHRRLGAHRAHHRPGVRPGDAPGDLRRRTVRTSILIPYGIITVIAAFAFRFAVQPDTGFIGDVNPLGSGFGSFATIILTEVWKTTPFMSLLLLAGLATVPEEMQEAAKVDGATAWQRLWKVTLPNMKAAILVALLFRTLDAFRIFDTVFVQTAGANGTQTISGVGYNTLVSRVNLGLGSAVIHAALLMIIAIAFLFVKGSRPTSAP